jgi:ABC-type bacteriocin/lantibiotic exporter with double-glycine peptidase domain
MEIKKVRKFITDFTVAYIPYTAIAILIGWPLGVAWWKACIIMLGAILLNMAVNIVVTVLSTYRFQVFQDYKNRKKA